MFVREDAWLVIFWGACGTILSTRQVLDVIAPPYTTEFMQAFIPLIENEDITGSLRNEDENDPVSEFIGKYLSGWV